MVVLLLLLLLLLPQLLLLVNENDDVGDGARVWVKCKASEGWTELDPPGMRLFECWLMR
jgi:hypothetical protein